MRVVLDHVVSVPKRRGPRRDYKRPSKVACRATSHQLMSAPGSGEGAAVLAQALAAYGCRHVFGVVSTSCAQHSPYRPADKRWAGRRARHGVWHGFSNRRTQLYRHAQ